MTASTSLLCVLILLTAQCIVSVEEADPGFTWAWPATAIRPDPSPGIVGEENRITIQANNYGMADAHDVEVQLNFNDWGVTYSGWQEIGTTTLDVIGAEGDQEHVFTYTFENRAHVCLEAKILSVGSGGNYNTYNDRTQINWEVVHGDGSVTVDIPFGNGGDEDIDVEDVGIECTDPDLVNEFGDCVEPDDFSARGSFSGSGSFLGSSFFMPCPSSEPDCFRAPPCAFSDPDCFRPRARRSTVAARPYLQDVPNRLRANEEVIATLVVPEIADGGMVVMVQAMMNGELNNVMIQIVNTTVEEMLNNPMLCCIESIKTRVLLESMLAEALEAYEAEDCKGAIKILRMLIQKAILLECDMTPEEKACIERMLRKVVDAARLIAVKLGTSANAAAALKEGDFFRRSGLYEAALLEYGRAC